MDLLNQMIKLQGDIEAETRACLALAKLYDEEDIMCPSSMHSLIDKDKSQPHIHDETLGDIKDAIMCRLNAMHSLINNEPITKQDKEHGYSREHLIYLQGCNIYQLAKQIHKESFITEDKQGKAEPTEGSLTN